MSPRTARLGDLATFLSGFAFSSKEFNTDGLGLPLIRIRDLSTGTTQTYYTGDYDPRYLVNKGDYLIGMDGEFNIAPWRSDPSLLNQRVCKIDEVSRLLDRPYLARYLSVKLKQIENATPFVTVKHLSVKSLREIEIPVPPIEEQRRIAQLLDGVDALRAKRRQIICLLDDLAQSIFLDMFGDPARNPMCWPVKTIGNLVDSATYGTSAKAGTEGDLPILRMNNITTNGEIDLRDLKYMDRSAVNGRHIVHNRDILFNRTNSAELVGKTAIYLGEEPLAYAGYLVRVRANTENDPEYLAAFLNTLYAKRILRSMCKSIIGMANINAREMQNIKIPRPPLHLQREFARRISAVRSIKAAHQDNLAELDSLFKSLQYRAFRGELGINAAA